MKNTHPDTPLWEKLTGLVGCILICATIGYLVWSAISSDHQPPEIHFKTVSVESLENRYLVMVDIKNVGDEAATEVHISAELKDAKDSTQRSTVKIDYLASKSTQRVGFYFESDPEAGELTFIPDNYLEP